MAQPPERKENHAELLKFVGVQRIFHAIATCGTSEKIFASGGCATFVRQEHFKRTHNTLLLRKAELRGINATRNESAELWRSRIVS